MKEWGKCRIAPKPLISSSRRALAGKPAQRLRQAIAWAK
jgi:hypothetical protein